MAQAIKINVQKPTSRYVALDASDRSKVVAEGTTAQAVSARASKTGRPYSMMFIPVKGKTYIL